MMMRLREFNGGRGGEKRYANDVRRRHRMAAYLDDGRTDGRTARESSRSRLIAARADVAGSTRT